MRISLMDGAITYSEAVALYPGMPKEQVCAGREALAVFHPAPDDARGLMLYVDFEGDIVTRVAAYVPHVGGAPLQRDAQTRALQAALNVRLEEISNHTFAWGFTRLSWDNDNASLKLDIAYGRAPAAHAPRRSAAADQMASSRYIADGDWRAVSLTHEDGYLYQLDSYQDGGDYQPGCYFIDEAAYRAPRFWTQDRALDVSRYCHEAQIAPFCDCYKAHITRYRVLPGAVVRAEVGVARANAAYGAGGAPQVYVDREQLDAGLLLRDDGFRAPAFSWQFVGFARADDMLDRGTAAHNARKNALP